jgi:hypothetical protein
MASPDPSPPAQTPVSERRRRWVAIITGVVSVLVGVLYLLLIALLDSRGPLLPPPPEALGRAAQPVSGAAPVPPAQGGAAAAGAAVVPPRG